MFFKLVTLKAILNIYQLIYHLPPLTPIRLLLSPLVQALSAGNCVALKPSELAPHTADMLCALLPPYLDTSCVAFCPGAVDVSTALLRECWDLIFYTGSTRVGKVVMRAAAEHLTPVVLELGGKSPCFVDASADLRVTARRICWGKFANAGQICIAPDYLLVTNDAHDALVAEMCAVLKEFYGDDPSASPDFARIVSDLHTQRLAALITEGGKADFKVACGGLHTANLAARYLPPTLLVDVAHTAKVMGTPWRGIRFTK